MRKPTKPVKRYIITKLITEKYHYIVPIVFLDGEGQDVFIVEHSQLNYVTKKMSYFFLTTKLDKIIKEPDETIWQVLVDIKKNVILEWIKKVG